MAQQGNIAILCDSASAQDQRCLDCSLTESCADYSQLTGFQSFSQALVKGLWESWPKADEVISALHLGFVGS